MESNGPTASKRDLQDLLLAGLTDEQKAAVRSRKRRVLLIAGAGSGKTEVMARRVAWWIVGGTPKDSIVAFTFTERAAEEIKFRIRKFVQKITPPGQDATLGGMYVGTIHGFCLKMLREIAPNVYHNYDVIDEGARLALVQRVYHWLLGLKAFETELGVGQYATIDEFLYAYDLLNEYDELDVELSQDPIPHIVGQEGEWVKAATLRTKIGTSKIAKAFAMPAARFYAYLRCRRFLDFSTSQSELTRLLRGSPRALDAIRKKISHVVVDEVQDINPVQDELIRAIVHKEGALTAVGDHRQAIFAWRGGRVEIMAKLYKEFKGTADAEVLELASNFRSTPRIIAIANRWAKTIGVEKPMSSPDMSHGNKKRSDFHKSHTGALEFPDRTAETRWIAQTIKQLVKVNGQRVGASHDRDSGQRGIAYADIAILLRSSTDARAYMLELERTGIPAVFRAGPDLFSQPEVLLFLAVMARMAGLDQFLGASWGNSLPNRIQIVLQCNPEPEAVIRAACRVLRRKGLALDRDVEARLLTSSELAHQRITGGPVDHTQLKKLKTSKLVDWLKGSRKLRRLFPQTLFHLMLSESGISEWDQGTSIGTTAMFHLGALSGLIKGIETPGWTTADDFKYQMIALCMWGTQNARTDEAPLLVPPDAVSISTIHAAKGLEFAAVFLADVNSRRFPSQFANRQRSLPFDGPILSRINPSKIADNLNKDGERRLMYVALTRAERYLFVTSSRKSDFFKTVENEINSAGGTKAAGASFVLAGITWRPCEFKRDVRLATSFSDLRYYLECPHDFYLRKVLGFAPSIDQAFGYGRGVHNLMREIHSNPTEWARLAEDPKALRERLENLVKSGLFYLRYTTGDPLDNMQKKALRIISQYVETYRTELETLQFEPEREFETLIEEEQLLVSGAIDIVRLDDPPRVTLIDFKSGEVESDIATKLTEEELKLQVGIYGLAAKHELEYEPDQGLVRYLGEEDPSKQEMGVKLDQQAISAARKTVVSAAKEIRDRQFHHGPRRPPRDPKSSTRCAECDFSDFCGMQEAKDFRSKA